MLVFHPVIVIIMMMMIMIANILTLTLNVGNVIIPFLQMKNWIPEYLNNLPQFLFLYGCAGSSLLHMGFL